MRRSQHLHVACKSPATVLRPPSFCNLFPAVQQHFISPCSLNQRDVSLVQVALQASSHGCRSSTEWLHARVFTAYRWLRTIVGTNATVLPASFCCREKALISALRVKTGTVTCPATAVSAADAMALVVCGTTNDAFVAEKYHSPGQVQASQAGVNKRKSQ